MTDLDPKVRDRAAQAAFDAFYRGSLSWETATESFKDRWRAVAEVLRADLVPTQEQLAQVPLWTFTKYVAGLAKHEHARSVATLEGPNGLIGLACRSLAEAEQMSAEDERDALQARVEELTAALRDLSEAIANRDGIFDAQQAARAVLAAAVGEREQP